MFSPSLCLLMDICCNFNQNLLFKRRQRRQRATTLYEAAENIQLHTKLGTKTQLITKLRAKTATSYESLDAADKDATS